MGFLGKWTFEPVFPLWALVALFGYGVLMAWFQYLRTEVYGLEPIVQRILFALRVLLFTTMVLLLAGPQWTREIKQDRPPRMVVLFDISESMNSAESADKPTAFAKIRDGFLKQLYPEWQDRFQFRFYTFAAQLASTDLEKLRVMDNVGGAATDLRGPLLEALSQQGANTPAAVMMLTDGNHNWGQEPTPDIFRIEEGGKTIPFIAVSTPSYGELRKSLAIHEITLPSPAFAKEPTEIRFQVAASGADNQKGETKIRIDFSAEGDKWTPMEKGEETKPFELLGSSNLGSFTTLFPKGGRYRIRLEASAEGVKPAEATREVEVEPGRWKIAFFTARPGWGPASFVRRVALVPRYTVQAAIGHQPGSWGFLAAGLGDEAEAKKTSLLTLEGVADEADLYVFDGLARQQYGELPAEIIRKRIESGAAVLLVGGESDPPEQAALDRMGVASVLPVDFSNAFAATAVRPLKVTEKATDNRATRAQAFLAAARDLPPSMQDYGSVHLSEASLSLIEFDGSDPCLAVRTSGRSRGAFLGSPDVWRWQFQSGKGGDALYSAYCSMVDNLIRWLLVGDEEAAANPVLILSQSHVPIGKAIELGVQYARATEEATATIHLTVTDAQKNTVPLPVHKQPGGFFTTQFTPADPGEYTFQVQDPAIPSASDEAKITAEPFSIETAISGAREDLLKNLAAGAGGVWVDVGRIASLAKMKELDPIYEPRVTTRTLTEPLMSGPWFFLLLILLFGGEWLLRRTHDLA